MWRDQTADQLRDLETGFLPKELIHQLSENLLSHYTGQPLIDEYAVYQHLMDYWAETMQDDCYQIAFDGWTAETSRIIEIGKKGKNKGKEIDKGWTCDLVPKPLIVARYFADEQAEIGNLEAELESATATRAELEEEHGGEGQILFGVTTDKGHERCDRNRF